MSTARTKFNEQPTNILETIVIATVGSLLIGKPTNVKLRGTQDELEAVTAAVSASTRFQEALSRPGATVAEVMKSLDEKHRAVKEFERVLNVTWPL